MMSLKMPRRFVPAALLMATVLAAACDSDDAVEVVYPVSPPGSVLSLDVTTSRDTVRLTWVGSAGATSYRAELSGPNTISETTTESTLVFTAADGLQDGATYTATVIAIGEGGETAGVSKQVDANFFPWDEYYATSLHVTGQGKQTFYNAKPHGGLEAFNGVSYQDLNCKTCHMPEYTGGCASCHESDNPQLGATVDASLSGACGKCHSRQGAEASFYSDAHRDAGMGCMECHTMGDVHGDGTTYASMLEDGAIDSKCEQCHTTVENHLFHSAHQDDMDCAVCHTQSVVTCYNCHFETEIQAKKKVAYSKFRDWNFLVNRNGKIHLANFQSVKHGDATVIGMAPFYAHTISRNAVTACGDCHSNSAVDKWFRDGAIDVVTWDAAKNKLNHRTGFIPVPPNFDQGGMLFDFVDLDQVGGSVWSFLETGPDRMHMPYGSPLTQEQMEKIR